MTAPSVTPRTGAPHRGSPRASGLLAAVIVAGSLLATGSLLTACEGNPPVDSFNVAPTTVTGVVLSSEPSPVGRILATGKGDTLYEFAPDTPKHSACVSSTCVFLWPPLVVQGTPAADTAYGKGIKSSLVGLVRRPDGSHQLTYAGHPLYTWNSDTSPGMVTGQAIDNAGGYWYVVSISGKVVMSPFAVDH